MDLFFHYSFDEFIHGLVQPTEFSEFGGKSFCRHRDVDLQRKGMIRKTCRTSQNSPVQAAFDASELLAYTRIHREYLGLRVKLDHFAINSLRDKDQIPEQCRLFDYWLGVSALVI